MSSLLAVVTGRRANSGVVLPGLRDNIPYVPTNAPGFDATRHTLDLEIPSVGPGPWPVLLWVHAGGFTAGAKDLGPSHWIRAALAQNVAVAALGYRLAPGTAFPGQRHDLGAAVRWLRANAGTYNLISSRMGYCPYSAGCTLAMFTALTADDPAYAHNAFGNVGVSEKVHALYGFSGPMRFSTEEAEMVTNFGSITRAVAATDSAEGSLIGSLNPYDVPSGGVAAATAASPYFNIPAAGAGAPLIRLEHGLIDTTAPYQQSQAMVTALQAAGYTATYQSHASADHAITANTTITDALVTALCNLLKA